MVPDPTIEKAILESDQNPFQFDHSVTDLEDFYSSLLDFDSMKDWVEEISPMYNMENPNSNLEKDDSFKKLGDLGTIVDEDIRTVKLEELVSGDMDPTLEKNSSIGKFGDLGALVVEDLGRVKLEELADESNPNLEKSDSVQKFRNLDIPIEEDLGKVADVDCVKGEKVESGGSSSDSESESESESESSDSSSSSEDEDEDEDEGKVKKEVEMEDGEIQDSDMEKMVGWSEDEFCDEDGGVSKGPIKSRNEIKDLPPVPPVEASLQPHHHTVPVGVVSSIIDAQVIVEGVEQHNPLNEGTIFWITESRSPLGIVDEIFGPVKSPFYIIRYNSENEVPEGIKQGTPISFVPEFANHVLKDNLYKKGYDASGENDEEISDDYEFSDDEQEAEFRKLQKMKKKRGTNEANFGNDPNERKNFKSRGGGSSQNTQYSRNKNNNFTKNGGGSVQNNAPQGSANNLATNQNQQNSTPMVASADNGNFPNPSFGQYYNNAPGFIPQFQQTVMGPGFIPPWMNVPGQQGMVMNGMPCQQGMVVNGVPGQQGMAMNGMPGQQVMAMNGMPGQQRMVMNGVPSQQGMVFPNGMMWQPQQQNMFPNGVPFPNQFGPNQNIPQNGIIPNQFGPWRGPFGQNGPNQQNGPGLSIDVNGQQCPPNSGEINREFSQGGNRGGGHGRGRFGGRK